MQRKVAQSIQRRHKLPPLTPAQLERTPEDKAQDKVLLEKLNRQRTKGQK